MRHLGARVQAKVKGGDSQGNQSVLFLPFRTWCHRPHKLTFRESEEYDVIWA